MTHHNSNETAVNNSLQGGLSQNAIKTPLKPNTVNIEIKKFIEMANIISPDLKSGDNSKLRLEFSDAFIKMSSAHFVIQTITEGNIDDKYNHAIVLHGTEKIKIFLEMIKTFNKYDVEEEKKNTKKLPAYFVEISLIKDNEDNETRMINFKVVNIPVENASLFNDTIEHTTGVEYRFEVSYAEPLNLQLEKADNITIPNLNALRILGCLSELAMLHESLKSVMKSQCFLDTYHFKRGIVLQNNDFKLFVLLDILNDIENSKIQEDIEGPVGRFYFETVIKSRREEIIAEIMEKRPDLQFFIDKLEDKDFITFKRAIKRLEEIHHNITDKVFHDLHKKDDHANTIDVINGN